MPSGSDRPGPRAMGSDAPVTAVGVLLESAGPRWVRVTWRSTVPEEHSLIAVDDKKDDTVLLGVRWTSRTARPERG